MGILTKVNRWRSPYDYHTDANGVEWRVDTRRPEAAPIKAYDPNFVQGRVATPRSLDEIIVALVLLIAILTGVLVGSAV